MTGFTFKGRFYRYYAPWLFRFFKLKARIQFKANSEDIGAYAAVLWEHFLAWRYQSGAKKINGNLIVPLPWKKKSDKLVILGCGSSINDVSNEEWAAIKAVDSIGVNYFYFHDFVPTAHFIELGKSEVAYECVHRYLLNNESRNEPVFMQIRHLFNSGRVLKCKAERVSLYSPVTMPTRNINVINSYLQKYYFGNKRLIHHCSTLDCVVNFAVQAGYKEILLVGVDLSNSKYFWDDHPSNDKYKDAVSACQEDYAAANWSLDKQSIHATADEELNKSMKCLSLIDYMGVLNNSAFKDLGIVISVANPNSLLTQVFNHADINTFIMNRN